MGATKTLRKVVTWQCHCARCKHDWESDGPAPPLRCARCKSLNWDRPAKWSRRKVERT
jgi:predicted Zn-ribbon and HTH transcriptional regulator